MRGNSNQQTFQFRFGVGECQAGRNVAA